MKLGYTSVYCNHEFDNFFSSAVAVHSHFFFNTNLIYSNLWPKFYNTLLHPVHLIQIESTSFPINCYSAATSKQLKSVLGMFAYYAKWIDRFADKVRPLANTKVFPISKDIKALQAFQLLKQELESAALHSIDESKAFVVECDASEVAVCATLNQDGRPVAFMSRTLQGGELHYPAIEKEATAIIEAIRKWSHLLRQTFTLVTDQQSVAFMLDSRRRSKIKNNEVQQWRMELASYSYNIKYRPGKRNVGPDTLSRAFCSSLIESSSLEDIHNTFVIQV